MILLVVGLWIHLGDGLLHDVPDFIFLSTAFALLLDTINATSFLVQLNESLAGGVLDEEGLGRFPDAYVVFLGQFY